MLGNYPIDVVLLATDLDSAKDFYTNKVGLRVVNDSPDAVTFNSSVNININPLNLLKKAPANRYRLINYTGALVTNAIPGVFMPQGYVGTLDFSTTNQVNLLVTGGPPVWDGGSASDSNWSDSANWGCVGMIQLKGA